MQAETKAQTEAEAIADAILKAAGTGLLNYMPSSRERIIAAAQAQIDASRADLLDALRNFTDGRELSYIAALAAARAALAKAGA